MSNEIDPTKRLEVGITKKGIAEIEENIPDYINNVQCDTTLWTQPFKCAVMSCPNVFQKCENSPCKFHNFPTTPELQALWLQKCQMKQAIGLNSAKVCTDHFLPNDYERDFKEELTNSSYKYKLKPNAVPSQHLEGDETNFANPVAIVCEALDKEEVRRAVDENILILEKHKKLMEEKDAFVLKLVKLKRKLEIKKKKCCVLQRQISKLSLKSNTAKEQKNLLTQVFSQSQINVLLGNKKVVWSNDDMAMAFTLRQMGNKECYMYLKNTLNIPLPSLCSVQKWGASK